MWAGDDSSDVADGERIGGSGGGAPVSVGAEGDESPHGGEEGEGADDEGDDRHGFGGDRTGAGRVRSRCGRRRAGGWGQGEDGGGVGGVGVLGGDRVDPATMVPLEKVWRALKTTWLVPVGRLWAKT